MRSGEVSVLISNVLESSARGVYDLDVAGNIFLTPYLAEVRELSVKSAHNSENSPQNSQFRRRYQSDTIRGFLTTNKLKEAV